MDVVDKIRAVATGNKGFHQDVPKEDVVIGRPRSFDLLHLRFTCRPGHPGRLLCSPLFVGPRPPGRGPVHPRRSLRGLGRRRYRRPLPQPDHADPARGQRRRAEITSCTATAILRWARILPRPASALPDPTTWSCRNGLSSSHGDALCLDDQAYQAYRAKVRDPEWQRRCALPRWMRALLGCYIRWRSAAASGQQLCRRPRPPPPKTCAITATPR